MERGTKGWGREQGCGGGERGEHGSEPGDVAGQRRSAHGRSSCCRLLANATLAGWRVCHGSPAAVGGDRSRGAAVPARPCAALPVAARG